MDARTFEPDEPLPRICKHCKHSLALESSPTGLVCYHRGKEHLAIVQWPPKHEGKFVSQVSAQDTCDQWEEKA
jgi:hypothetical protein